MQPISPFMRPEVMGAFDEAKRAPYRTMTPEQRVRLLDDLCNAATALVLARGSRVKPSRQPVPKSTRLLLDRLRAAHRLHHGSG